MLQIFFLLIGFMCSQSIADGIRGSMHRRPVLGWCIGLAAQYLTCVALLVFLGNEAPGESLNAGLMLTWLIRTVYLLKRLPRT